MWQHKVPEISHDRPYVGLIYSELVIRLPALPTLDRPALYNIYSALKYGNLRIGRHIR
jgi:hypothetical protein